MVNARIRCVVVGSGVIALSCCEVIRAYGFEVLGVHSADRALELWCSQHSIEHFSSAEDLQALALNSHCNYCFYINGPEQVRLPSNTNAPFSSIAFYDSPLPFYAGFNSASWAIFNGETRSAVTWATVNEKGYPSDILSQTFFDIGVDESAIDIQRRVVDMAQQSLASLLRDIENNQLQPFQQPHCARRFYREQDKPVPGCIIDLQQSCQSILNLVRGLHFENTPNPIGIAKLLLPGAASFIGVRRARKIADDVSKTPGTLLAVSGERIQVCAADGVIEFELLDHKKFPHGFALACSLNTLAVGDSLPRLDAGVESLIAKQDSAIAESEQQWLARLAHYVTFVHPYCDPATVPGAVNPNLDRPSTDKLTTDQPITNEPSVYAMTRLASLDQGSHWQVLFALYIARIVFSNHSFSNRSASNHSSSSRNKDEAQKPDDYAVGWFKPQPNQWLNALSVDVVPVAIADITQFSDITRFTQAWCQELAQLNRKPLSRDVYLRYPQLADAADWGSAPVLLAELDNPDRLSFLPQGAGFALVSFIDGSAPVLRVERDIAPWQLAAVESQLCAIAGALQANPQAPLTTLPLLEQTVSQQILQHWNNTAQQYPSDTTVDALFKEQVQKTPSAVAVKDSLTQLSYQQLDDITDRWAIKLQAEGAQPGVLVALCLPRGVAQLAALLAVIKTGAAYVPVDPEYPSERIDFLLQDSNALLVLTNGATDLPAVHKVASAKVVPFSLSPPNLPSSATKACVTRSSRDCLYVLYTSGSTGKPKGVAVSHRSLINHSFAFAGFYRLSPSDAVLQSASISFDVSAEQIFPAWFRGSAVVVRPNDLLDSFLRFEAFIEQHAISTVVLPTGFWHEWVHDLSASGRPVCGSLNTVCVGTEKVRPETLRAWERLTAGKSLQFCQGYGPTEATITCSFYRHQPGALQARAVPIGRPLPNTRLYVLDAQLEPVPVGFAGELYIAGDGLAIGYHGQPELTLQRFIYHRIGELEERLYRTGDTVRWSEDGQLVFLGRNDFQVKIRGMRIEVGEIESVLIDRFPLKQAVVHPISVGQGQPQLVAYVVPDGQSLPEASEILDQLAAQLPAFMVPSAVVEMPELPVTHNLKIDYARLPNPASAQASPSDYQAPADDLEVQVAAIWRRCLGVGRVGREDSFFNLGGDSLRAVAALDQISKATGVELSMGLFFSSENLRDFCHNIRTSGAVVKPAVVPLNQSNSSKTLFFICGIQLYQDLAAQLEPHYQCYGVYIPDEEQIFNADGQHQAIDVVDFASRYLSAIDAKQLQGGFSLAGISFGGLLAYEMARQCRAKGVLVDQVLVFDTVLPSSQRKSVTKKLWLLAQQFQPLELAAKLTSGQSKNSSQSQCLLTAAAREQQAYLAELSEKRDQVYWQAMCRYDTRPQPYDGTVLLFEAEHRTGLEPYKIEASLGWRRHVSGPFVQRLCPGDHLTMILGARAQGFAQAVLAAEQQVRAGQIEDVLVLRQG